MLKKRVLLMGATLMAILAGCGNEPTNDSTSASSSEAEVTTLTVGVMPSTDNIPLLIAHEQGFDVAHGVDLDIQSFSAARDRDAAFQAEEVDGINSDLVAFSNYIEGGMDVKVTSATYGEFDLITNDTSAETIADLAGQDIVIANNQGPEYAVTMMLEEAGLSKTDVNLVDVPPVPSRVELLQNDQAQAAIVPEPFVTIATADGLKKLSSTRDAGVNPFILCFPQEVIDEKAEAIRGMYDAYNEAVAWMKTQDSDAYIQLFIDEIGFPETLKDQIEVPDYPEISQATDEDIRSAFEWSQEKGLLTKEVAPEDVLSDVYFN